MTKSSQPKKPKGTRKLTFKEAMASSSSAVVAVQWSDPEYQTREGK